MSVIDFGKNTCQCEITFKFDCLSPDFFVNVAKSVKSVPGWHFGKDQDYALLLTIGDGTPANPFFQIKLAAHRIALWAGWHATYNAWQEWRTNAIANLYALSGSFPTDFVSQVATQTGIAIPIAKLKRTPGELPDLKPIFDFYRKYIPEDFLSKGAANGVFSNEDGTRLIETQTYGSQQETIFNFIYRWTSLDAQQSVVENIGSHFNTFDQYFQNYQTALVGPLIRE